MEPHIENHENLSGGDFINRPHESFLLPIIAPQTLARLYSEHHEQLAASTPQEALVLAERFCRQSQVPGVEAKPHPDGFDWVLTPSHFTRRVTVELWRGRLVTMTQTEPGVTPHQLDATLRAGMSHNLFLAYMGMPDERRTALLGELLVSLDLVEANRIAADRLHALRAQPELPGSQRLAHLDIAGLLQRYEVPEDQAKATEQHLIQEHGGALTTMHGSQVLAAAHQHSKHPGLFGAPWQTWLCEVVSMGNDHAMEACLRMGADPNVPNAYGEAALHIAARQGQHGFIRRLVEVGADPSLGNPRGETALHVAAENKHARACLELLAAGADPGQRDNAGRKPGDIHQVREKGREQTVGL
ncbi:MULTISPECIES: ankyrin repeat domain-containing protein [Xanthomonas translucens group]|uniref:ankyrin repeat domain-containing protein n=1 Tax=Xanthomonas translucens group TaxID=3390202 RepID=UPI001364917F|nr:ankyrin repeat domain-containing protein [Xanthomonas translucens]UKE46232.1 ankyrin repeat domain-containing protein [Xanthomonas translucens pv. cerealis]